MRMPAKVPNKKITANKAASTTIAHVVRKIKRMMNFYANPRIQGEELIAWLLDHDKRANKAKGGLGVN